MSFSEFKQVKHNWSLVTQKGNALFEANNHESAIKYYQHALFCSELMVRNANYAQELNIQIVSPFFVSCLNMANNFWAMNDLKKAGDYFLYNVWHLKMLCKREGIGEEVQLEAIQNWEKAVLSMVDFYTKTGQDIKVDFWKDETYEQIMNTRKWIVKRQTGLN